MRATCRGARARSRGAATPALAVGSEERRKRSAPEVGSAMRPRCESRREAPGECTLLQQRTEPRCSSSAIGTPRCVPQSVRACTIRLVSEALFAPAAHYRPLSRADAGRDLESKSPAAPRRPPSSTGARPLAFPYGAGPSTSSSRAPSFGSRRPRIAPAPQQPSRRGPIQYYCARNFDFPSPPSPFRTRSRRPSLYARRGVARGHATSSALPTILKVMHIIHHSKRSRAALTRLPKSPDKTCSSPSDKRSSRDRPACSPGACRILRVHRRFRKNKDLALFEAALQRDHAPAARSYDSARFSASVTRPFAERPCFPVRLPPIGCFLPVHITIVRARSTNNAVRFLGTCAKPARSLGTGRQGENRCRCRSNDAVRGRRKTTKRVLCARATASCTFVVESARALADDILDLAPRPALRSSRVVFSPARPRVPVATARLKQSTSSAEASHERVQRPAETSGRTTVKTWRDSGRASSAPRPRPSTLPPTATGCGAPEPRFPPEGRHSAPKAPLPTKADLAAPKPQARAAQEEASA